MKQEKIFIGGGMDTDSAVEYIDQQDYISAWNIRNVGTDSQELGYITSIEGTNSIILSLPIGINKCVGGRVFKELRKAYAFIYNSNENHLITEYDFDTNSISKIYEGNLISLNPTKYVTDINIIDGVMYFLPSSRIPSKIDIELAKSGYTFQSQDLLLIKPKPTFIPKATVSDDRLRVGNLIENKVFKFNVQHTFKRDEESVFSEPSKAISSSRASGQGANGKNNCIIVTVGVPDDRVKEIVIGGQINGNPNWVEVLRVKREHVIAIEETTIDLEETPQIREAYNPTDGTYSFVFSNDGLYPPIDIQLTNLEYDRVPKTAEAQELLNDNILAYGNLTEGYNTPEVDVSVQVSYTNKIAQENQYLTNFLVSDGYDNELKEVNQGGLFSRAYVRYDLSYFFKGNIRTGDKITLYTKDLEDSDRDVYEYTCPAEFDNNTYGALQDFANKVGSPSGWYAKPRVSIVQPLPLARYKFTFRGYKDKVTDRTQIDLANSSSTSYTSVSALKLNSNRKYGIMYEYPYGRLAGVSTNESMLAKSDSYGVTHGSSPSITLTINNTPPEGAIGYYVVSSGQLTHQKTTYMVGEIDDSGASDQLSFDVTSLYRFNEDHTNSVVNYSYTKGDRATFALYESSGGIVYFDGNPMKPQDLAVTGFEVDDDGEGNVKYILRVQKGDINPTTLTGKNVLIEVYTPKLQAQDNNLFYTIGERYDIVNGEHSVKTITIDSGEVYIKSREYRNPSNLDDFNEYVVEDLNYSDFEETVVGDLGRPYLYSSYYKEQHLKSYIRYGDVYNKSTGYNQINRFKSENIYGINSGQTSERFGEIMKMRQRSTSLLVFQELEVGYIPVNTSIYEDVTGQSNVAVSDKLLNNIRYNGQGIGIGKAVKSFAEKDGDYFFVDPNKSQPVKADGGGIRYITGKMSKHFQRILQESAVSKQELIGYINDFYKEYSLSFETKSGVVVEIPTTYEDWYGDNYEISPNMIVVNKPAHGNIDYDEATGIATYTPDEDYIGADPITMGFLTTGGFISRNICMSVIAGNKNPEPFSFTTRYDQPISTVIESESIAINGTNIPSTISISNGEYSLDEGVTWTDADGIIQPYDVVRVRVLSSSLELTNTQTALTIGGYTATFTVITESTTPTEYYTLGMYEKLNSGSTVEVYGELRDASGNRIDATVYLVATGNWDKTELSTSISTSGTSTINIEAGNSTVLLFTYDSSIYSYGSFLVTEIIPSTMDGNNIIGI